MTTPLYQLGLLLLIGWFSLTSCQDTKNATKETTATTTTSTSDDVYLPSILSGTALGQDRATVLKNRPQAVQINSFVETPYESFTEDSDFEDYTTIRYNFTRQASQQLVQLHILHTNMDALRATLKIFDGKLINNANAVYERTLSDKTVVYALVTNLKVTFYLKEHLPNIPSLKTQ